MGFGRIYMLQYCSHTNLSPTSFIFLQLLLAFLSIHKCIYFHFKVYNFKTLNKTYKAKFKHENETTVSSACLWNHELHCSLCWHIPSNSSPQKKMFIFLNRYTFVFVNLQHKLNLFSQFCHYLRKCNELLFLNYKQKNVCSKYENLKWEKTTSQCDQTNALVNTSIVLTKCICIKCFFRSLNTPKLIRNHCVKCCNMIIAIWFFKITYQNWTRKSWLKIKFICFDLIFYF